MRNFGLLATTATDSGQLIYLNNPAKIAWDGVTVSPWLVPETSPFQLANNQRGQPYTPQASAPPDPRSRWYDLPPVTETLPIQASATTVDAAVQLLELLQRVLLGRGVTHPPLFFEEAGGVRRYAAILDAKVQETPDFFNVEYHGGLATVLLTITRTPFFGRGALTTLYSGTVGNKPTGSPANRVLWSTQPSGPLAEVGLPLTLTIPSSASAATLSSTTRKWARIIAATVRGATQQTLSTAINLVGVMPWSGSHITLPLPTSEYTKLRFLAKVTGASGNARALVYLGTGGDGMLYTSPWLSCSGTTLVDFGGYLLPAPFTSGGSSDVYTVEIQFDTAGGTLNRIEVLEYYTYGWFDAYRIALSGNQIYTIASARTQTIGAQTTPLLHPRPRTTTSTTADGLVGTGLWRGEPPIATVNGGLWLAWGESGTAATLASGPPEPYRLTHSDTETITLTAQTITLAPTFWPTGAS